MRPLSASQKNRRERIADAMRIEWNGYSDQYSADLWMHLLTEQRVAELTGSATIHFGGQQHTLTLTQVEDLAELVHQSYHSIEEARRHV